MAANGDKKSATRVVIAGGGTGGHLFPGLALAEELTGRAEGHQVLFVGTSRGIEARRVPAAGYPLATIEVRALKGRGLLGWLRGLARLPRALLQARRVLRRFRPQVVVGVGGYASAPVVMAAWLRRLPILLLEQNALPGFTNRWLGRLARRVVVPFEQAARFFKPAKVRLLGNPVRSEIAVRAAGRAAGRERHLLIFGGSQGARALNQVAPEAVALARQRLADLEVRHQTGAADLEMVQRAYGEHGIAADCQAFIEDMAGALAWADLVLCRAGATSVAELAAAARPAILVPYPHAADDHQTHNARALVQAGAAHLLPQAQLEPQRLAQLLHELFSDPDRLEHMSRQAGRLARPQAVQQIAELCLELARARGGD